MKKQKVIKEFEGKKIYLVDQVTVEEFGVRKKYSFWRTTDDKEHFHFMCKIPENKEDIDVSTLSLDCLSGKEEIK